MSQSLGKMDDAVQAITNAVTGAAKDAASGIEKEAQGKAGVSKRFSSQGFEKTKDWFGNVAHSVSNAFKNAFGGTKNLFSRGSSESTKNDVQQLQA